MGLIENYGASDVLRLLDANGQERLVPLSPGVPSMRAHKSSTTSADSDSTPAISRGFVYTAAENGVVYCFRQSNGELVWKYQATGGTTKERSGFWASPIVVNGRLYIGSSNGYLYCLTADKGEVVWRYKARGSIWGTSPLVDGRLIFGDKAGWLHAVSAEDGARVGVDAEKVRTPSQDLLDGAFSEADLAHLPPEARESEAVRCESEHCEISLDCLADALSHGADAGDPARGPIARAASDRPEAPHPSIGI